MEGSLVFLFVAMVVTWLVVFLYLLYLNGRLAALRRELDNLKRYGHEDLEEPDPASR